MMKRDIHIERERNVSARTVMNIATYAIIGVVLLCVAYGAMEVVSKWMEVLPQLTDAMK